jgi:hypothetical protein
MFLFPFFFAPKKKGVRVCFFAKEKDEPKVLSLRKLQINLFLFSLNRTFGFAEDTHVRKNSNNNLVFPSLNRIFADETNSISIEDI